MEVSLIDSGSQYEPDTSAVKVTNWVIVEYAKTKSKQDFVGQVLESTRNGLKEDISVARAY